MDGLKSDILCPGWKEVQIEGTPLLSKVQEAILQHFRKKIAERKKKR